MQPDNVANAETSSSTSRDGQAAKEEGMELFSEALRRIVREDHAKRGVKIDNGALEVIVQRAVREQQGLMHL